MVQETLEGKMKAKYGSKIELPLVISTPIAITLGSGLVPFIEGEGEANMSNQAKKACDGIRSNIQTNYGFQIPGIRFRFADDNLDPNQFSVFIYDRFVEKNRVPLQSRFFFEEETIKERGIPYKISFHPLTKEKLCEIKEGDCTGLLDLSIPSLDTFEFFIVLLQEILQLRLDELLDSQQVFDLLGAVVKSDGVEQNATDIIRDDPDMLILFTLLLRTLLAEQVPIRKVEVIANIFVREFRKATKLLGILHHIRTNTEINEYLPGKDSKYVWVIDPTVEKTLIKNLEQDLFFPLLDVDGPSMNNMIATFRSLVINYRDSAVFTWSATLRPILKKIFEYIWIDYPIISKEEIDWENRPKVVRVINWDDVEEQRKKSSTGGR